MPSTTFECMFIDYKAINYITYGDKSKSFEWMAPYSENA